MIIYNKFLLVVLIVFFVVMLIGFLIVFMEGFMEGSESIIPYESYESTLYPVNSVIMNTTLDGHPVNMTAVIHNKNYSINNSISHANPIVISSSQYPNGEYYLDLSYPAEFVYGGVELYKVRWILRLESSSIDTTTFNFDMHPAVWDFETNIRRIDSKCVNENICRRGD